MEHLTDLKAILHSKRANIYYIEKCRVLMKDGRVVYLTETKSDYKYWNIPIANTTVILLGMGTSITQAAVRMLASAGVLIGFSGTGGTPLISGNEIEWINPQSEYRPTEYVQGWMKFWFDDEKRLKAAKYLQNKRLDFIGRYKASKAYVSYTELVPWVQNSNETIHHGHITKRGSSELRTAFVQMSLSMIRMPMKTGGYRIMMRYQDMKKYKENGRSIVATSRKLATIVHSMLTKRREFDPAIMLSRQ